MRDDPDQIIRVRSVCKTYGVGRITVQALKEVSLDIGRGDFVAITGRNGAGKSTLLHSIALLDTIDRGEIFIDGRNVTRLTRRQRVGLRLEKLGFIFQEHALISELNALENVMLPAMMRGTTKDARKRAEALLERVQLSHCALHLPHQLSGGEQQKVAIARALVNKPAIIYADEPTAGLDSIAAREVLEIFTSLNHEDGHTVVMVTHEEEEVQFTRRRIVLSDGQLTDDRRLA